ncbi:thiol:disulfide interchange protein DsbA/DsbL [Arenimonas fontis]|uniref:Thiol:disulfide interchange protein DsbA n=1 Tax=Arenimonas fontis TaxID=2608255 RepID=A0A5B2Z903_9GAMM|nr:thiol:disulfide interchange protein DsbA/DsbL [Arenimonas fontis]KAA2284003.1 thiol:disulfide interchange protein DsbA/DsbL [Arenimonas fontis]
MKRLLAIALLALLLVGCGREPAAPDAQPVAPAPETSAPAAATEDTAPAGDNGPVEDAAPAGDADAQADEAAGAEAPAAEAGAPADGAVADIPPPSGPPPREGVDYEVLPTPQPTYAGGDGIEVAEVFSYTCIHCANLQPHVNTWKAKLPADVRFVYVPAAFGGAIDNFARGYFAAEAMGLLDRTHDAMFQAVLVERRFQSGSEEEIADWYAAQGADRGTFLSTMRSFAVTGKVNRARQFGLRTGVSATPTMIVAGKYRATATRDRGMQGLLDTVDWLVARERGNAPAGF